MEDVIEYLEMKNHFYAKFYSVTSKFLDCASKNDWRDMDFYVESREKILSIIRSFDTRIEQALKAMIPGSKDAKFDARAQQLLNERKELGEKIVALDLQLISIIDDMKTETIHDLKKELSTQSQLNSFHKNEVPARRPTKIGKA